MVWINKNVWILTCESDKKSLDEPEDEGVNHFNFLRRVSAKHSLRRKSRRKSKIKRLFRLGYDLK